MHLYYTLTYSFKIPYLTHLIKIKSSMAMPSIFSLSRLINKKTTTSLLYHKSKCLYSNSQIKRQSPFDTLNDRDLIQQFSSPLLKEPNFIDDLLKTKKSAYISAYCGFDPTASSLHLGNLISIISLIRMAICGFKPIFLIGGATGAIGDPSGKSKERELLEYKQLEENIKGVEDTLNSVIKNIYEYLQKNQNELGISLDRLQEYEIVNNKGFYTNLNILDFIRDIGRHFRMGVLIHKESVTARMASPQGMSFMEFTYQTFQAYDYLRLFQEKNCMLQIGGSDQWGNITNGCDLIHKVEKTEAFAITTPLLVTASGKKFGKSEGNAIWITPAKGSGYDLFQYLYNTTDADVIPLLKKFTFLPVSKIKELDEIHKLKPEKRVAQKALADIILDMLNFKVKPQEEVMETSNMQIFFTLDIKSLKMKNKQELRELFNGLPRKTISLNDITQSKSHLIDLLVYLKLKPTKAEIRRLISGNALTINGDRMTLDQVNAFKLTDRQNWLGETFLIVRFGKKEYHLIEFN